MAQLEGIYETVKEPECTCETTGKQKCLIHKVCIKCGHTACHCCENWCDTVLHHPTDKGNHTDAIINADDWEADYPRLCCDGACTYE
jgi:hypothetical protein